MRITVEEERWKGNGGAEGRADEPAQTNTRLGNLVRRKTKTQAQKRAVEVVSDGAEERADKPSQAGTRLVRLVRAKKEHSLRNGKWSSGGGEPGRRRN